MTTWWKRCYEGLRGARFVSPFLRFFAGRFGGCWVVLCFFVCLVCFGVASENSTFNYRFTSFADFQ